MPPCFVMFMIVVDMFDFQLTIHNGAKLVHFIYIYIEGAG